MNTLTQPIEPWLQSLMLLTWKGTLLAAVVGLALLLLRRHLSPAWRHGLWLLVLLRFAVPDLGYFAGSLDGLVKVPELIAPAAAIPEVVEPTSRELPPEQGVEAAAVLAKNDEPPSLPRAASPVAPAVRDVSLAADSAPAWSLAQKLFALWLCGALAVLAAMVALHVRLERRIRQDASEAFSELGSLLDEACRMAGVRRAPRLMVTDAVRAPSLFGVLRPVILLPRQVAAGRDAAALKLILLHELAHLQRHDLWSQMLSSCVIVLHWFNPAAWMAARRLRAEAEMAADARALSCTDATEAHRFGEMLLGFSRYATTSWLMWLASATLLGISENKNDLRRRIEGLMDIARGRRTRWVLGMTAFAVLAVVGLTRAPAEDAKKASEDKQAENMAATVVKGIVVDEQDKPVSGAVVKISMNQMGSYDSAERVTGVDGKFSFEEVPKAASVNLRARHSDYAESKLVVFPGISAGQERRLVLPGVSWIHGKITDKRDGRPIKGARVFFGVENKIPLIGPYEWMHPFAQTNEAGEYRLKVKLPDVSGILVRAWAPDMAVQTRGITFTGREAEFDAALEPAQLIPASVVDAVSEPVKDVMVWVVEDAVTLDESFKPITLEKMRSSDRVDMAQGKFYISLGYTKEDGAVQLPEADPLLKHRLWVVAMHPMAGFAKMRAADLKPGAVFKLEKWASMSGRMIRSDGSPLADATVHIHAHGEAGIPRADTLKITHSIKVTTDPGGAYKIDHLLPGATFSGVTIDGVKIKKEYVSVGEVTVGGGAQGVRQITLGTSLSSRAAGGVRSVQGRIVLPEGYGLQGADYTCYLSIITEGASVSGLTRPDKDGRFITELLPPGVYELSVTVTPRNPSLEWSRDAGRWLRFRIEPGAGQQVLHLEDIVLTKEDLTPKPRPPDPRSQPPVFAEGPDGKIEVTTVDADRNPVPGVKVKILAMLDAAYAAMDLGTAPGVSAEIVSDERGKAVVSFPRAPAAGKKAAGVQVAGLAPDGRKSKPAEMMDGRKYELRVYAETPVSLTASEPIVRWSASGITGLLMENQPLNGCELKGRLALEHGTHFVVQGVTAGGKVLFSKAVAAAPNRAEEVKGTVTLEPGVEIEGRIEKFPANDDGSGGMVAHVFVRSTDVTEGLMKGRPPAVSWTAWAPVSPDGRFHFKSMPRGIVTLRGLGKGWATGDSRSIDLASMVDARGPAEKVVTTLSTRPCIRRTLRLLLPDGSPAAGATVKLEMPGIGMLLSSRGAMYAEDPGKHAEFKKAPWMGLQAVADDQGQVVLENRPAGRTYCQVFWVDPKTRHPHGGSASFAFEDTAKSTPLEVKVQER